MGINTKHTIHTRQLARIIHGLFHKNRNHKINIRANEKKIKELRITIEEELTNLHKRPANTRIKPKPL